MSIFEKITLYTAIEVRLGAYNMKILIDKKKHFALKIEKSKKSKIKKNIIY